MTMVSAPGLVVSSLAWAIAQLRVFAVEPVPSSVVWVTRKVAMVWSRRFLWFWTDAVTDPDAWRSLNCFACDPCVAIVRPML